MAEQINNPKIGTIVRHTGWGFEKDNNYPCDVLITKGSYISNGRLSNFWYWQRVLPNGTLAEPEHGYGSFEKSNKNYDIETLAIDNNWNNVYSHPALQSGNLGPIKIESVDVL